MVERCGLWTSSIAPEELIAEIEHGLSEPRFRDVALDQTLQDIRVMLLSPGTSRQKPLERLKSHLRLLHGRLFPVEPHSSDPDQIRWKQRTILIASISQRDYSLRIIPRIAHHIGASQCTVISNLRGRLHLKDEVSNSFSWTDSPKLDMPAWRKQYEQCEPEWINRLNRLSARFGLIPQLTTTVRFALMSASQRVTRFDDLLDRMNPRGILIDYDRNSKAACLVLAARKRNIPTATLVHGEVHYPLFYTPILADRVFCWGEQQKEWFIRNGTPSDRIRITGFPRIEDQPSDKQIDKKRQLKIPNNTFVVLFASNPIEKNARMRNIEIFCKSMNSVPNAKGLVRLHPSESMSSVNSIAAEYPGISFSDNTDMTSSEALNMADVIVAHSSGFAGEALAIGKLVVIVDATEVPIGPSESLERHAGTPLVHDELELADTLKRIFGNPEYRSELSSLASAYIRQMYACIGESSCKSIAEEITAFSSPLEKADLKA